MSSDAFGGAVIGQFRACLDLMAAGVARAQADLGLSDYRPRFSAVVRVVAAEGPTSIRLIAQRMSSTHSAASQTVSQMAARGLVELRAGSDARQRLVHLTRKAQRLRPLVDAEGAATAAAIDELNAELSAPLEVIVRELTDALQQRSFHDRIVAHLANTDRD